MSFSRRNTALVLFTASFFAGATGFAVSACSSSTNSTSDTSADSGADTGTKPRPDGGVVNPDSGQTQTRQQCIDACFAAAPTAASTKYKAVDTCWTNNCNDPCVNGTGSFDAGADSGIEAGALDGGNGLCGTPVASGTDQACDTCTTEFCCAAWAACYNNADCSAIDTCLAQCPQ